MTVERKSAPECHALIGEGYIFLDVRTEEEFRQGHAPGAYNLPWAFTANHGMQPNPDFLAQVKALFPTDSKLVIGCAGGVRSLKAAEQLAAEGYQQLVDLRPGMVGSRNMLWMKTEKGWRDEGLPMTQQAEPGRSYEELEARWRDASSA